MFPRWGNRIAVAAVLAAVLAAADAAADPAVSYLHSFLPPPEYDKPYTGKLTKRFAPLADIPKLCGGPGKFACARVGSDACDIVIAELGGTITLALQNVLIRHELGHCNGWPGDHPRSWRFLRWLPAFPSATP
jgi:hypothetical protein